MVKLDFQELCVRVESELHLFSLSAVGSFPGSFLDLLASQKAKLWDKQTYHLHLAEGHDNSMAFEPNIT